MYNPNYTKLFAKLFLISTLSEDMGDGGMWVVGRGGCIAFSYNLLMMFHSVGSKAD